MDTYYRLGIDAGGTFTDFVLADKSGNIKIYKTLSTPNDPTKAIGRGEIPDIIKWYISFISKVLVDNILYSMLFNPT